MLQLSDLQLANITVEVANKHLRFVHQQSTANEDNNYIYFISLP